eukprot:CAMPEP_0195528304 /NCGR_PEP_ID=MMETSP0794_2-20130614/30392_1 /TAXON_ID=515487 /ORGANISM="Stephanopyxis turris, Strain CCMP 815" /LENGTH=130 /DNA_ID=CAMNT_0040659421 /DNA_START=26 /DNA_END=414 /DNA_ORIENTATION=-
MNGDQEPFDFGASSNAFSGGSDGPSPATESGATNDEAPSTVRDEQQAQEDHAADEDYYDEDDVPQTSAGGGGSLREQMMNETYEDEFDPDDDYGYDGYEEEDDANEPAATAQEAGTVNAATDSDTQPAAG